MCLTCTNILHCQVCQFMNQTCGRLLTTGFLSVERYHSGCLKRVKAQLPRRESERRNHPLARHCDILSAIETRLSLLGMTFMKYVDCGLCCFIPGKVVDEIYKLLRIVQTSQNINRVHDLLQELRDISSMAMEHFEERIAPKLKSQMHARTPAFAAIAAASKITMRAMPGQGTLFSYKSPFRTSATEEIAKLQQSMKQLTEQQRKDMKGLHQIVREQKVQITEHQERIRLLEERLSQNMNPAVIKLQAKEAISCPNEENNLAENFVALRTRSKRQAVGPVATAATMSKRRK